MESKLDVQELLEFIDQATPAQIAAMSKVTMDIAPQTIETFRDLLRVIVTYPKKE